VTTPVTASTDATDGIPEVQEPPDVVLDNVVVAPSQTEVVPVMAAGVVFTVTIAVAKSSPITYDISAVPAATPVTNPVEASTVAIEASLLLQLPPDVACPKAVVLPVHTEYVPVTGVSGGVGVALTMVAKSSRKARSTFFIAQFLFISINELQYNKSL
jgi:hypothetical protein